MKAKKERKNIFPSYEIKYYCGIIMLCLLALITTTQAFCKEQKAKKEGFDAQNIYYFSQSSLVAVMIGGSIPAVLNRLNSSYFLRGCMILSTVWSPEQMLSTTCNPNPNFWFVELRGFSRAHHSSYV